MSCKNKNLIKVASILLIGAFSFGLSISCVNVHKKETIKVSAEESDGTWTLSNGSLSFQYTEWQTNGYVKQTNQSIVYGHGDGTFDITYELLGEPPGATTAGTEYIADKTIQLIDGYWTPSETGGYGTVTGYPVDVNGLDSGTMITLNINVQYSGDMNEQNSGAGTPEPPDLSALEWYFNEDMGYFATHLHDDGYYSFALSTNINSVIYDRANSTVTAHCIVDGALEGNMPEEYYEVEMTFAYTFDGAGLVEDQWHFYNAVCEATVEETESLYFSVDVVSFRQLGWYFDEDLRYYAEEGVEASWNILHAEYRTQGSCNELILYMQVLYNSEYFNDVIQINNPDFDEAPYRGQTTLGTGVSGWSDKLQQNISIMVNYVAFGYYANGWSYDPYFQQLVYINADDIDIEYQLTSASSNEGSYLLTYTCDGDSQSITVTDAVYDGEMLTGYVTLYNGGDIINVSLNIPESIVDTGSAYDEGWTYEPDNQKLVYYLEEYGIFTLSSGTHNIMDKIITLSYVCDNQTMTIDIDYSGGECGYNNSAMTASGYARLNGSSSTAEFVTVLLQDSSGNMIPLTVANTWVFDGNNIAWINANSTLVTIDDLRQNMTDSTFYVEEGTENQFCEIEYTYDGRVLPTLTITQASFEERELSDSDGIEYVVSGIHETSDGATVTVTIPSKFWNPRGLTKYVVSFDANGGEGEMDPESLTPESDGGSVSYPLPDCNFTREGFSFAGWATSESGDNLTPAGEDYNLTGSTIFYAMWTENPQVVTYTVSFDGNGATSGYVESIIVEPVDGTYSVELPDNNYARDGYSFYGWSLFEEGGLPFNPGTVRSIDEDTTFYVYWIQSSFTITFNANGGTGEMAARTYEKGNQEVPGCDFVKEGYTFAGWAVDSVDSETIVNAGDIVNVNKDYTLYALWEENSPAIEEYSYEIVYDANNGSGKTSSDTFTDLNSSLEYELLSVSDVGFSYEGFTFVGWSLSVDGDVLSGKVTVEAGTTKLYAIWEEESIEPEPTPEYKQYWTYDDLELRYVDEAHPDYLTRVDKAIYSERSLTASVLVSILNEQEEVVDTKYISLSNASYEILEEGYGSVTGYFNLLTNEDKVITLEYLEIAVEKIPVTPEEKAADVSDEQIAQINSLLPEAQDSRIEEVIGDLNQGTAYQIVEVATDAKSFIDELREEGGEGYTEEDYQRDLQTVQSATEAAVVVGAASKDSNITAQVQEMTKSAPQDTGVDLNGVLKDFYEQQMKYLLGEDVASKEGEQPSRGIKRAEAPKVNKVSVDDYLKQEFDQMLDFVDRSVDDIEDTLLQVRKCSHESVKLAVNQSITTITSKSFRDFDKAKADREFVETLEPVMMATMQSQVLAVLEEEYNNSDHRNKDKDQVILDEIEAVKDIEMFRIMVMEVLRQKYESLDGSKSYKDDLEKFTEEIYWPCFEAWALDKESPVGFTFEELTKATIESSSKRANSYVIATSADKPEIVFISVFAGVTAVAIAGAIAVPTVLKKKRRGLAE